MSRARPAGRRASQCGGHAAPQPGGLRGGRRGWVPLRPDLPALQAAPATRRRPPERPRSRPTSIGDLIERSPLLALVGADRVGSTELGDALRRTVRRHRRLLAATCAGLAVVLGLGALRPKPAPTAEIVVAARDLPAGAAIAAGDVRLTALPAGLVPSGALRSVAEAAGQHLAAPVRRAEPVTDVRLTTGPLSRPSEGLVAMPVRFADVEAARLLQPGERIDVLAAVAPGANDAVAADAAVVAADVAVVALPPEAANTGSGATALIDGTTSGALVVLATTPAQARTLAQAEVTARLFAVVVS